MGRPPRAFVGHSLGEYAAAHLAGVLDLRDAVALVVRRAEMMERVSGWGGTMATIALGEKDLHPRLGPEVSLAAVNAVDECVVSGPSAAVDALLARLAIDGIDSQRIPLSAAAHSSLLDPILPEFARGGPECGVATAGTAVHLQPHGYLDHTRAGMRSRCVGRSPPGHRPLRRRAGDGTGRRARSRDRGRSGPHAHVLRPPPETGAGMPPWRPCAT